MVNRKREFYKHKRKIIRRIAINEFNIEGHMKSIGYRLLGFSEELLEIGISLFSHMRSSMPAAWLKTVMLYIHNSGNALEVFY